MLKRTFAPMAAAAVVCLAALAGVFASPAEAQDKLKVAISQRGFWDSSFLEFAQREGMLKKAGLDVEFFYTEGGGQTRSSPRAALTSPCRTDSWARSGPIPRRRRSA